MKKVFNKIWLLVLMITGLTLKSQTTFTITDVNAGNAGSADVVLSQARTSANAGNNFTVLMNAPGLCNVSSPIDIGHSAGSVTIDKHPSASVPQGFTANGSTGTGAISSSTIEANITVKNITCSNIGIPFWFSGGNTIVFDHVIFNNYSNAIRVESM